MRPSERRPEGQVRTRLSRTLKDRLRIWVFILRESEEPQGVLKRRVTGSDLGLGTVLRLHTVTVLSRKANGC